MGMKEDEQKFARKAWKKSRKRRGSDWSGRNRPGDQEEAFRQIRKDKKNSRVNWQELLLEEEYDIDDG